MAISGQRRPNSIKRRMGYIRASRLSHTDVMHTGKKPYNCGRIRKGNK